MHVESGADRSNFSMPPPLVLALLVVVLLVSVTVGSLLVVAVGTAFGFDMTNFGADAGVLTTSADRNRLRLVAGLNQVFTFLLPAMALAWIVHRGHALRYLNLSRLPGLRLTMVSALFMISTFPLAQVLYQWNSQLPLPNWMMDLENSTNALISALLVADGLPELFANLILIGIIPALGEEFLFRGILQKELERWTGSGWMAVWIAAIVFSAIHFQFQGFLPRVALGAALGYVYLWTGNLWVPVLAHLLNNGLQVIVQYVTKTDVAGINPEDATPVPWWIVAGSMLLMTGLAMSLVAHFRTRSNKTEDYAFRG
jgi:membrane protease YdiL (CAAX protease family)